MFFGGQVKHEIHCEQTQEGRRVTGSVSLDCRERLRVGWSPPLGEGIERAVRVTQGWSTCLEGRWPGGQPPAPQQEEILCAEHTSESQL